MMALRPILKLIPFGNVDDELRPVARDIIDEYLKNTRPPEGPPTLIHLCGIPGAGKSRHADQLAEAARISNFSLALIGNDRIMERLEGYQADREIDRVKAFETWEEPARMICYHLLHVLIDERRNILYDHGANFPEHVTLLRRCREEKGYRTVMHHILCPLDIARERTRRREELTGRHTPEHFLPERQKIIGDLLPKYEAVVDRFITVDGRVSSHRPNGRPLKFML
jgi:predicted ABC-type ATPase